MGPFFALGRLLGLAPWLVHRLWLGALLALAAWGTLRLLDALLGRPRGVAHVVAGLLVLLNPYVVVFTARTTVTLLGYAALPWLLLAVHRGLRAPRSWWWPAAFALVVTCSGGGVNAAVTAWLLLGPLLLALYERLVGGVGRRALLAFGWRTARADRAGVAVVGGAGARAGAPRRRLPALHRAARDDLVDHQPLGVAAADGLLAVVPRRRLRRRRCARCSRAAG